MNIRKNIDYSSMFEAMDAVVTANIPQMELYRELGRLICAGCGISTGCMRENMSYWPWLWRLAGHRT